MRRRPLVLALLAALAFSSLAAAVEPGPILFDEAFLRTFASWRGDSLTVLVVALTQLGGHVVQIALGVAIGAYLLWRHRPLGVLVATSLLGSFALNEGLKLLFARPRPILVERITDPRGLSFPSGHAQSTIAFGLCLALVAQHLPSLSARQRRAAWGLLLLPLVVGWTRNYLGVHYPTDVIAGWCAGVAWVLGCYAVFLPRLAPAGAVSASAVAASAVAASPDSAGPVSARDA